MDNFEKAILVIAGIAIGAVAVYFYMKSKTSLPVSYAVKTYSNIEEWEIVKDSDGRVRGVKVHRKAEEG
jgi:hypothetical protein